MSWHAQCYISGMDKKTIIANGKKVIITKHRTGYWVTRFESETDLATDKPVHSYKRLYAAMIAANGFICGK